MEIFFQRSQNMIFPKYLRNVHDILRTEKDENWEKFRYSTIIQHLLIWYSDEITCLLITEKILFWTFWRWEMRTFFEQKVWCKDYIYLVFWVLHDIPGLEKYSFSCSVKVFSDTSEKCKEIKNLSFSFKKKKKKKKSARILLEGKKVKFEGSRFFNNQNPKCRN